MARPALWETPEALQTEVDKYFDECKETGEPVTMSGLALALDCDRKTLTNYANKDKFFPTIKKARQRVEAYAEARLFSNNVAGVIFNLKNNFGWKDKTEQEISSPGGGPVAVIERTIVKAKPRSS